MPKRCGTLQEECGKHEVVDFDAVVCGFELVHLGCVPVDLALMDVVVLPGNAEIVAVGVAVAVESHESLIDGVDGFSRILDHDNVVAEASRIVADVVFSSQNPALNKQYLKPAFA